MPTADGQPDILSITQDAFGRTVVTDTEGVTVLDPSPGTQAGSTFAVNVSWGGGKAEIRWSSENDQNNNRSLVHVGLYGAKTDGYTTWGNSSFLMRANGDGWSGWYVSVGGSWVHMAQRDVWVGHDAAGACWIEVGVLQGEIIGTSCNNIWGTQGHWLANYVVLPYAPQNIRIRSGTVATTSFGVEWTRNTHDTLDSEQAQWALDSGFGNVVWTDNGPGGGNNTTGYSNPAGMGVSLTPGTLHYVRSRSHTSRGWGPWSATVSQTTLPAVAPGLAVVANPSGTSAVLTFSAPGGVTGVTKYRWRRRVQGQTDEVSGDTVENPRTVDGLTPGTIYEWRATAFIDTYESPSTGWIAVQQPNPNTSPGDYFDGDTADKPDADYVWDGDPHGSSTSVLAEGIDGWITFTQGHTAGATGATHRTAGGATLEDGSVAGAHAARVVFWSDTTEPGFSQGTLANVDVVPGGTYYGSMYVFPSRTKLMFSQLIWHDAGGIWLSVVGGPVVMAPANRWTRLPAAVGVAPSNAEFAAIRVADGGDVGVDWEPWRGGDTLVLDAAMVTLGGAIPYFDGDTADTPTADHVWEGDPNASISSTDISADTVTDPLADPDCPRPPAPPRPPYVNDACIVEVGTWQRYWAVIPEIVVTEWLSMVPTILLKIGGTAARQVRVRIYPNPNNETPEGFVGDWSSEQIVSYIPPNSQMLIDGVDQRVWATVEGSPRLRADHLLYGSDGAPATWPVLSCGIGYLASFDVPVDAPVGNLEVEIALTQRRS
jgi:hypothetical protein